MVKEVVVSGKLITKDVVTFMFYHNYSHLGGMITGLLGIAGLILAPFFLLNKDMVSGIIFALLALIYVVITPFDFYSKARRQIHTNPVFKNKMTFTFSEARFKVQLYTGASEVVWKDVIKVIALKKHFLIYIQETQALIVPKRHFPCTDDVDIVMELIEAKQLKLNRSKRMEVNQDVDKNL